VFSEDIPIVELFVNNIVERDSIYVVIQLITARYELREVSENSPKEH